MLNSQYRQTDFSGRTESVLEFFRRVNEHLPARAGLRILDIGCGTGDLLFMLADKYPDVTATGLDLSETNITAATTRAHAKNSPISFVASDYLAFSGQYDVLLADTVLHLIPCGDARLAQKLASDLISGGTLMMTIPRVSLRNRLLVLSRRLWRLTPASFDEFALWIATLLYRDEPKLLRERIVYLRVVPERLFDASFVRALSDAGFAIAHSEPMHDPSLFKLRHDFIVLQRS